MSLEKRFYIKAINEMLEDCAELKIIYYVYSFLAKMDAGNQIGKGRA